MLSQAIHLLSVKEIEDKIRIKRKRRQEKISMHEK